MISHHANAVDLGKAPVDIDEAVRDFETSRFVLASRQAFQLEQFLAYYPMARILLLEHKDLREHREATLARVFAFLGVDAEFRDERFTRELNASGTKRESGRAMTKLLARRPGRFLPPWIGLPLRRLLLQPFSKPMGRRELDPQLRARLAEVFAEDQRMLNVLLQGARDSQLH